MPFNSNDVKNHLLLFFFKAADRFARWLIQKSYHICTTFQSGRYRQSHLCKDTGRLELSCCITIRKILLWEFLVSQCTDINRFGENIRQDLSKVARAKRINPCASKTVSQLLSPTSHFLLGKISGRVFSPVSSKRFVKIFPAQLSPF